MVKKLDYVIKRIRKNNYCLVSTVSEKSWPQTTGIIYATNITKNSFELYIMTERGTKKFKNIEKNNQIAVAIPYKRRMPYVPPDTINFQAKAEIIEPGIKDVIARKSFEKDRIAKMQLSVLDDPKTRDITVFIKITPLNKINCFGLGIGLISYMKNPFNAFYSVEIK